MGFRQLGNIQAGRRTVRIYAGIQINIVGTGQLTVYLHSIVTGKRVIHLAFQRTAHAADIRFPCQIHRNLVAAAEGDVVAGFVFTLLLQFSPRVDSDLIGGIQYVITEYKDIFRYAATLAFHLVVGVHIRVGVEDLALAGGHFGIIADDYIGLAGQFLFRLDVRRDLDHPAHVHVVVPAFIIISAGDDLVGRHHIALPGIQLGAVLQLGFGVHLHVVVGVGPGNA